MLKINQALSFGMKHTFDNNSQQKFPNIKYFITSLLQSEPRYIFALKKKK